MTIQQLITKLYELDIKLALHDGKLTISAPNGTVTPALRAELAARKAELLAHLERQQALQPIPRKTPNGHAPLSFAQQRLWFLEQIETTGTTYHLATILQLTGRLDIDALKQSLTAVVARHEVLRSTYLVVDGVPMQRIASPQPVQLQQIDLTDLPPEEQQTYVSARTEEEQQGRFKLAAGPLWRFLLFHLGPGRRALALIMHHLITDEWSTNVLVREVSAFYSAFVRGHSADLPPLPIQYADYARWQRQQAETPLWQMQLQQVQDGLTGAPPLLQLPLDGPRPAVPTLVAGTVHFSLSAEQTTGLTALAHAAGTTLYTLFLTAFSVLLARYSQQHDLVIGSPVANRERQELEGLIGFLVNTLALRINLAGNPSFRTLLTEVRTLVLAQLANVNVPFEQVVEALQPERHLNHNPLFQVMFVWQNGLNETLDLPDLQVELIDQPVTHSPVDLLLTMREIDGAVAGRLLYSTELFAAPTIEAMADHFRALVAAILADPDRPIDSLPLYGADRRAQHPAAESGPTKGELAARPVHELFEAQVSRTPDARAIYYESTTDARFGSDNSDPVSSLSYRDLNTRANQLAHALLAQGCIAGQRIAICAERSPDMVAAILAVSKIGAAYVPLDPGYPMERLAYMLNDAQVSRLLAQRPLADRLPETPTPLLWLDDLDTGAFSTANPAIRVPPTAPLYQIYTSGSTGQPKGVVVPHAGVANTIQAIADQIALQPGDRLFQFVPFGFDASAIDFFAPLSRGAALVLHPNPTRLSAEELLQLCCRRRVSVVNFTVALWQQWVDNLVLQGQTFPSHLRVVLTGGDKPSARTLRTWANLGDHPMLYCCSYGPTEASITTTFYTITNTAVRESAPDLIPLGPPLPNTTLYLLDAAQQLVPRGVPGEIWIGGIGVADGYWQRPALTAERFIDIPDFTDATKTVRLYRTGDLARRLSNGECEFVGRVDNQVKIRGFRIELGEIETQLRQLPGVQEAVVLAVGSGAGDKRLAAYVQIETPHPTSPASEGGVDRYQTQRLRHSAPLASEGVLHPHPTSASRGGHTSLPARGEGRYWCECKLPASASLPARGEGRGGVHWEQFAHLLKQHIPAHMIPTAWMVIDAWPMTPNGKIDRSALPEPVFVDSGEEYIAPRTALEADLATIWQTVLGVARVSVTSNFFTLGGHSLLATQVVARIQQRVGVALPLRTLFEKPTIAELATEVAAAQGATAQPPLVPVDRTQPLPLSFAQQRLWLLAQIDPESTAYNIPGALRLTGQLHVDALQSALDGVVARHESLRTRIVEHDGQPGQVILPPSAVAVEQIDLRWLSDHARLAAAHAEAADAMAIPFDPARAPLLRCKLFQLDDDDWILFVLMHHIITDGWSIPIFMAEVAQIYRAYVNATVPELPPLPIQYADYAHWQRTWLQGDALQKQLDYWVEHLAGAPALLDLPADHPRPAQPTYRADGIHVTIEAGVVAQLNQLAQDHGATLYMVVLSAFALLLARYSSRQDLVIGSPIANRTHPAVEGLIGFFVNTLALRIDLAGEPSFSELLRRVRAVTVAAYAHQDAPFEQVVEALQLPRSLSHAPLFQVLVAWQSETGNRAEITLPDIEATPVDWQKPTLEYDLALSIAEDAGTLSVTWQYSTDLFAREKMVQMANHFRTLLAAVTVQPEQPVTTLSFLTPEERDALLAAAGGPVRPAVGDHCVHHLFEAQVARTPAAPALYFHAPTATSVAMSAPDVPVVLTYGELNAQANQLAHALLAAGHGKGERIAIALERSPALLVAALAVLKTGAAYLPLDVAYPAERLRYLLADADVSLLITAQQQAGLFAAESTPIWLIDGTDVAAYPAGNPSIPVTPTDPFYQIYTSGSTGLPKGVLVPHKGIANTLQATTQSIELGPGDRFFHFIPIGFDAAAIDLFAPLITGAAAVLHPTPTHLADQELLDLFARYGVTSTNFSTARWHQLVNNLALQGARFPSTLRLFLTGGEKPSPQALRTWATLGDHEMIFVSSYGPSEASISASMYVTTNHQVRNAPPATIGLGEPLPNVTLYLLDAKGQLVPVGVPGELYIGGIGVADGYWHRPALTVERFVEMPPFDGSNLPLRLYRTGDVARRLADGTLEFVGRVDNQVKIRGFRIELGEIETQIRQVAGVRDALVLAVADANGEKQLVAYVQPDHPLPPSPTPKASNIILLQGMIPGLPKEGAARSSDCGEGWSGVDALRSVLPPHMLPAAWITVDTWPLTPNGKIDRNALPLPNFQLSGEGYVAPSTPVEEELTTIWQAVLGVEPIGVETNFFDLGGHSLNATQVVARIQQRLGVALPLRTLFAHPTIRTLAQTLAPTGAAIERPPLLPADRTGPLPLSFTQQRLWMLQQLNPESGFFNMPAALRLEGPLDLAALQAAFDALVARHESLRTSFPLVDGTPVQQIAPPAPLPIGVYPASRDGAAWEEATIIEWVTAQAEAPFALETGPLLRVALLHISPERHLLLVNMHHTIGDDWSRRILMDEFSTLYRAHVGQESVALPPLPLQYADFAGWQRAWLQGPVLQEQLDYWREQLTDAPPLLALPTDRPRPPQQRFIGGRFTVELEPALAQRLRDFSRAQGCTLHMTLLAGFAALLSRYSGMDDLVIGIPVAGRTDPEIEGVIGVFLNTLALRIRLLDEPGFATLLDEVKRVTLDAYAHQDAPFEQVIEAVNPAPQLSHTPIFQVMFDLAQADRTDLMLPGLRVEPVAFEMQSAKFDLNLVFGEAAGAPGEPTALHATWEYNSDIFARATVDRMARHLQQLLNAALAEPSRPVAQLPLLTLGERRRLLERWNRSAHTMPGQRGLRRLSMQQLFEAQVARTPDVPAARDQDGAVTYRNLNARANRWAHHLITLGVDADVIVTPFWARDLDYLTAILAIFKAGGAYLPLDPETPTSRIAQIIEQSRTPLVLTNRTYLPQVEAALAEMPPACRPQLCLIEEVDATPASTSNPPCRNRPDSLAYVIFTSGSTGVPKGVMVEQRGLVNHLIAMQQNLAVSAADVIGQTATQSYVISVWQFLAALTFGGTVRIVPEATVLDPAALVTAIDEQQITVVQVVPSLLRLMIEVLEKRQGPLGAAALPDPGAGDGLLVNRTNGHGGSGNGTGEKPLLSRLRWMIPTGEALPPALARRWFAVCPHIPLLNAYGSSECSDDVAHDLITQPPAETVVTMPIGRPLPNVQMYVLDAYQEPVPLGVAGELYVGGAGVGRGYLHDAERTRQVFLPNPFSDDPNARLYKTGDRVRRLPDGSVEYLGRFDFQVKVRGIRVELGEIEATLSKHPAVAQAVVVTMDDAAGQKQLAAYVVCKSETDGLPTPAPAELRRFLRERLPDYMVPGSIVPLDALPLNTSGKVARRLLPAPAQLLAGATQPYVAPRNPVEATLVEILADVMGLDPTLLGVHHNFFDLGGHSMQAIRIVWQLQDRLGVSLPLRTIFAQTTVESLATLVIEAQMAAVDDTTLAALFAEVGSVDFGATHTCQVET